MDSSAKVLVQDHNKKLWKDDYYEKILLRKIIAATTVFAATAMTVTGTTVSAVGSPTLDQPPATVITNPTSTVNVPVNKDIVLFN